MMQDEVSWKKRRSKIPGKSNLQKEAVNPRHAMMHECMMSTRPGGAGGPRAASSACDFPGARTRTRTRQSTRPSHPAVAFACSPPCPSEKQRKDPRTFVQPSLSFLSPRPGQVASSPCPSYRDVGPTDTGGATAHGATPASGANKSHSQILASGWAREMKLACGCQFLTVCMYL
jgi:hypothetical protein